MERRSHDLSTSNMVVICRINRPDEGPLTVAILDDMVVGL
ncbi:hypothetical protein APY04_1087 [Hyphomicrobium sulfonivorans]|uniref:Uncharacterized protein n=1 Tax=Hyphomicrobium sulfonivorans TaxID=121290 RepID=A0A109BLM3_HYPSL|nr:hypothetical protein APY04_1087 [Hyphomicrobium sulfonivorans]